jgi:hypothetical protein
MWKYGTGNSSAERASSHFARALPWHFGQCRLRHVMESSPLHALWGVIPYGESYPRRGQTTGIQSKTVAFQLPITRGVLRLALRSHSSILRQIEISEGKSAFRAKAFMAFW